MDCISVRYFLHFVTLARTSRRFNAAIPFKATSCGSDKLKPTAGPTLGESMRLILILDFVFVIAVAMQAVAQDTTNRAWLTKAEDISLPQGFRAELVYAVPMETQGSWVALTVDAQGSLITSDQYGKLYRVSLRDQAAEVEPLDVQLGSAQGLFVDGDALYVMVNESEKCGLWRVQDVDDDGQYERPEQILKLNGSGEHGVHAVVPAPNSEWLYICAGNHTALPDFDYSHVPAVWDEDHLLPRFMDPGGHAAGIRAPGGWVCRVTRDGSRCELLTVGFRNEYDLAVNSDGELFTFDADMEWDLGTPWYRPTRVNHVIPGVDYGWRSGSSKWTNYFIDSLPAAIDIGPGSPTGIAFGYGTTFPEKYQRALFIADWSQGRLLAADLEHAGATYRGSWELFASAPALPITDVVVNPTDGALYFTIGGRKTQSALYRIVHDGANRALDVDRFASSSETRRLRQQLEKWQRAGVDREAVDSIWEHLGHPDRTIRYAARVALEHQPVHSWKTRLREENFDNVQQQLSALVALVRFGHRNDLPLVIDLLTQIDLQQVATEQQLDWLRVLELAFIRLGPPEEQRDDIVQHLRTLQDTPNASVQRELAKILVYLNVDGTTTTLFEWIEATQDDQQRIHLLMVLRMLADTFSSEQAQDYFELLKQARLGGGGKSYGGYIDNIADDAFQRLPERWQPEVQPIMDALQQSLFADVTVDRPFVKRWTVDEALLEASPLDATVSEDKLAIGRQLFAEAQCIACHRVGAAGRSTGPDLTSIGSRMSPRDLLVAIIEPDIEISDQYQNHIFELDDGTTVTGRIINLNMGSWYVNPDMRNPGQLIEISRANVENVVPSPTSTMPSGLIDTLSGLEVRCLLQYLMSARN